MSKLDFNNALFVLCSCIDSYMHSVEEKKKKKKVV